MEKNTDTQFSLHMRLEIWMLEVVTFTENMFA